MRSEEVRAFVDFLTEKFAPDSFKGIRSASSSGRRRAKEVAVVVYRSLIAVMRLERRSDQAQMLEAGVA